MFKDEGKYYFSKAANSIYWLEGNSLVGVTVHDDGTFYLEEVFEASEADQAYGDIYREARATLTK